MHVSINIEENSGFSYEICSITVRKIKNAPRYTAEHQKGEEKEATMGIEPMMRVLQTLALPLGHVALIKN
jgi:hypothetical protein